MQKNLKNKCKIKVFVFQNNQRQKNEKNKQIGAQEIEGTDKEHAVDVARQNCMQANYIVSDIIDYFKVINNQLDLNKSWFTVNQLQQEISKIFEEQMKERCIRFSFDCQIEGQERINTDFQRLKQILINILSLSLKYTTEGNIHIGMSYYDTKKETIEFVLSHTESFLPRDIVEQLRQTFSIFDLKYDKFTSGKNLQLLLCQALIEKIGPSQCFDIKQDEGYTEIRFKIFSNFQSTFKTNDSRTQFISFNKENNQAFFVDQFNMKSLSKIENSFSQPYKKNSYHSNTHIDFNPSIQGIPPQKSIQQASFNAVKNNQSQRKISGGYNNNNNLNPMINKLSNQSTHIRNPQTSIQFTMNSQNNAEMATQQFMQNQLMIQQKQLPQILFESACLLTEEIQEKKNQQNDQQIYHIYRDYKMKSKCDIETINTLSKIRSTADTFDLDFLEDVKKFLNYSRILIVDDSQDNIDSLTQLLTTKVHDLEIDQAENSRVALQKIIQAENESFQYSNPNMNYRLIIMRASVQIGETFQEVKKMKNYMKKSQNIPNTPIILICKEHNEEQIYQAENAGALALVCHPLSLENLQQSLKKINIISSFNQISC